MDTAIPGSRVLPGATSSEVPGVPAALAGLHHTVGWNDRDALADLFAKHGSQITLVLIAADYPHVPHAADFYRHLRELTSVHGALLGYDEMVTGFRVALGGMAEFTGVLPDLSVFGKAVANGMPLAVYSGRRDVLAVLDRGEVVVTSTYGGETLSLAAATGGEARVAGDTFRGPTRQMSDGCRGSGRHLECRPPKWIGGRARARGRGDRTLGNEAPP